MGVEDGSASSSASKRAENAEKEATKRIQAAESNARKIEAELKERSTYVQDQFQKQYISQEAHQEALLETQRLKGYQNLRALQSSQIEELSKVRQEGDSRLNDLRNYYRDTKYSTEQHGNQDLKDLELSNEQNLQITRKTGSENVTDLTEENLKNTAALTHQYEHSEMKLKADQQKELERKRIQGETANEMADEKHQERFAKLDSNHREEVKRLESNANKQIHEIRQQTADKLTTYKTRQNDPFYKLMDLGSVLSEDENGFTLNLKVPEYEQKHFRATVKGENLVIMGQRRNEETLDLGNGVTQGTASFQSYHESFPLPWPVDANRLSKEFKEDQVTVRVPKKNKYAAHEQPHVPAKTNHETTQFPTGIQEFYNDQLSRTRPKTNPTSGTPGSGPLT